MGKPTGGYAPVLYDEHIVVERELGELKHLSSPRKRNDSLSSGERKGKSPNLNHVKRLGVVVEG